MIKKTSKNRLLVLILVVVLLFSLFISGCIQIDRPSNEVTFDPFELKNEADNIAYNWSESAKLVYVRTWDNVKEDGTATRWIFTYACISTDNKSIEIIIGENMEYTKNELEGPPRNTELGNWKINSLDMVQIAKQNEQIEEYLSRNPQAIIERIAFVGKNNGTWTLGNIQWRGSGLTPPTARVWIDCTIGEVIEVDINE